MARVRPSSDGTSAHGRWRDIEVLVLLAETDTLTV